MSRRGVGLQLDRWGLACLLLVLLALVFADRIYGIPSTHQLRGTFEHMGVWGAFAYAGVYAPATLSPLPKSVFTIAAGAIFGIPTGLLVVVSGATSGAVMAFLIARTLGSEGIHALLGNQIRRFDTQLETHGLWTVLVARLIPIVPFTAFNYVAGISRLRLSVFIIGTLVGMLPATTAYVAIGAYGSRPGSWPMLAALGGLGALLVVSAGVTWRRRHSSN